MICGMAVRLLWRAAAAGLAPLRLPRARNKASSCPGIFSRTLCCYYVASSPGSPLSHLLDGHRKLVGCSPARCVCCFVLLTQYWGIVTVPGSFLKSGDLGCPDPNPPP